MPLINPSTKLIFAIFAIITQLIVSVTPALATGATPPLTKCHIQIHDAHISKYILRTQGKGAVKVNADSKCDKFIQDLRLTVEIYKIGRFTHYFITRHTTEVNGFIHGSFPNQLEEVAGFVFAGCTDELVVLHLDIEKLEKSGLEVRIEDGGNGQMYPHIYGAIPFNLVDRVTPAQMNSDGHLVQQ
ncbi:MAG: DUF952 domain-containing protein [Pseudomonadota bacterium]|nr:DUF952 domain-containing protein [Pseudomonadota bacterium]